MQALARNAEWVVYAKPPFGGPTHVFEYLGRYTHRVALSNDRILDVAEDGVTFQWKDYRNDKGENEIPPHASAGRRVHPPFCCT